MPLTAVNGSCASGLAVGFAGAVASVVVDGFGAAGFGAAGFVVVVTAGCGVTARVPRVWVG